MHNQSEQWEVVQPKEKIQMKWDLIVCRSHDQGTRLKEAYFMIAEYATGEKFNGSREDLHKFVVSLNLKRFIENTLRTCRLGRRDLIAGISHHSELTLRDLKEHGSAIVYIDIERYKWKNLVSQRVMIKEPYKDIFGDNHRFSSKSGVGARCTDWQRVK